MSDKPYRELLEDMEAACALVEPMFTVKQKLEDYIGLDDDIGTLAAQKGAMVADNNAFAAECKATRDALEKEVADKEAWAERSKAQLQAAVDKVQAETEKQIKMYREEEAVWKDRRDQADLAHSTRIGTIREETAIAEGRLTQINNKLDEARKLVAQGG